MKDRNSHWMMISGVCGLSFFCIANFTNFFINLNIAAAVIQISINLFVFITWTMGFIHGKGFKRLIASFGVVVPFIMAGITIVRVIVPILNR